MVTQECQNRIHGESGGNDGRMDSEVLFRHRSGGERGFPRGRKTPADTSEDVDVSESVLVSPDR